MAVNDGDVLFFGEGGASAAGASIAAVTSPVSGAVATQEARLARLESEVAFLRGRLSGGLGGGGIGRRANPTDRVGQIQAIQRFGYRLGRDEEGAGNALGGLTALQKAQNQTALAKAVAGRAGGSAIGGLARASVLRRTLGLVKAAASGQGRGVISRALGSAPAQVLGASFAASAAATGVASLITQGKRGGAQGVASSVGEGIFGIFESLVINPAQSLKEAASGQEWTEEEREDFRSRAREGWTLGIGENYRRNKRIRSFLAERERVKGEALAEANTRIDALTNSAFGDAFQTTFALAVRTGNVYGASGIAARLSMAVNNAKEGAIADAAIKAEEKARREVPPVK